MTQPQQPQQPKQYEIPPANFPICNRVVSDHPLQPGAEPLVWQFVPQEFQPHPLVQGLKIVRMFIVPDLGVEVYSASPDGKVGTRNIIPWSHVRLAEEMMDAATFVSEIVEGETDDDDDPEPDPEQQPQPGAPPPMVGLQPMPPPNGSGTGGVS
jgi:hypothetical protein